MNFPAELKYSKSHEWVRMDGEIAVVGISDFLLILLLFVVCHKVLL